MKNIKLEKTISFGKVEKNKLVEINMELSIKDNKIIFSASGNLWNNRHSDIEMGG